MMSASIHEQRSNWIICLAMHLIGSTKRFTIYKIIRGHPGSKNFMIESIGYV